MTMLNQGCEWPAGCNMGAFRNVAMQDGGSLALCLRHAGRVWNARKQANREAGLCPCGANPTPGYRTCATCRERGRRYRRRSRAVNARAAECGIRLPREAGRRRAFLSAYREGFKRSQKQALRAWRRSWARGSLRSLGAFTRTVAVPWEGHAVTVRATFDLSAGGMTVHGIPARAG